MDNFESYNPVKIIFGKDSLDSLGAEIKPYGKKALILIGQGSVKKNGLYARLISLLNINGIEHITFEGIKSSPESSDVDKAIAMARQNKVDMLLAVGGCSVIDTAKALSIGFYSDQPIWNIYMGSAPVPDYALPLFNILTIASTGTAMNNQSVLQNKLENSKKQLFNGLMFPKASFLDATYTFTVPPTYTSYGVSITVACALEQFFGKGTSPLSDHFSADVIRQALVYGTEVLDKPDDYEVRANLLWLATTALNGTLSNGKTAADWGVTAIANTLDVMYNLPHGISLAIVYPAWLKYHQNKIIDKLCFLAENVFNADIEQCTDAGTCFINRLCAFYQSINCPVSLNEVNIDKCEKDKICANLKQKKATGAAFRLNETDYNGILELMWAS